MAGIYIEGNQCRLWVLGADVGSCQVAKQTLQISELWNEVNDRPYRVLLFPNKYNVKILRHTQNVDDL